MVSRPAHLGVGRMKEGAGSPPFFGLLGRNTGAARFERLRAWLVHGLVHGKTAENRQCAWSARFI